MAADLIFYINQSADDPAQALVANFRTTARAKPPIFFRGSQPTIELHFLKENPDGSDRDRPFVYEDPSTWTVKCGAGEIDAAPNSGTFTFTDPAAGQTTGAIAYNASAATVQTAIRAACTTNFSACTVTGNAGGPWTVDRVTTTAFATDPTIDTSAISPAGSTGVVDNIEDGTSALSEKWTITLVQGYAILRTSGWSALPSLTGPTVTTTAGSATANETYRLTWSADAYEGNVVLTFTGDTETSTLPAIPWNATATEVLDAFEAHTDVDANGVAVTKNGPGDYTIVCVGTGIRLSSTPALVVTSNTLRVPVGLTATLSAASVGVGDLLGSETEVQCVFEVEKTVSGVPTTVCQITNALLRKDLIRNTPGSARPTDNYLTSYTGINFSGTLSGYTGGGSTNLDGIVTTGLSDGFCLAFVHSTDGLRFYELVTGTDAESSPGIIRPDDYNGATNAKVWKSRL